MLPCVSGRAMSPGRASRKAKGRDSRTPFSGLRKLDDPLPHFVPTPLLRLLQGELSRLSSETSSLLCFLDLPGIPGFCSQSPCCCFRGLIPKPLAALATNKRYDNMDTLFVQFVQKVSHHKSTPQASNAQIWGGGLGAY